AAGRVHPHAQPNGIHRIVALQQLKQVFGLPGLVVKNVVAGLHLGYPANVGPFGKGGGGGLGSGGQPGGQQQEGRQ
nr:hypothetical protein [Tanacetum cinerariifolium]